MSIRVDLDEIKTYFGSECDHFKTSTDSSQKCLSIWKGILLNTFLFYLFFNFCCDIEVVGHLECPNSSNMVNSSQGGVFRGVLMRLTGL